MSELEEQRRRRERIKALAASLPPVTDAAIATLVRLVQGGDAVQHVRHPKAG